MLENINNNFKRRMDDLDKRVKVLEGKTTTGPSGLERPNSSNSNDEGLKSMIERLDEDLKNLRD